MLREKVLKITNDILEFFLEKKLRIPTSQTIVFVNLLETIYCLKKHVNYKDIADLAESTFTLINWNSELKKELIEFIKGEHGYRPEGRNIASLLNGKLAAKIRFGKLLSRKEIFTQKTNTSELLEYIALRKTGVIRKTKSGQLRVVDYKEYNRILNRYRKTNELLKPSDILRYIDEIPSRYWRLLLNDEVIENASLQQLLKFSKYALSKGDTDLGRKVLSKISDYVGQGAKLHNKDKKILKKLMEYTKYEDVRLYLETITVSRKSAIGPELFEKIVSELSSLPLNERVKIISKFFKHVKQEDINDVINRLDIISLTNAHSSNKRLASISLLGQALTLIAKSYILGEQSFLDYGVYILEKINPEELHPVYRPVYESLVSGNFYDALKYLPNRDKHAFLEYVLELAREINIQGASREAILRAIRLSYRLMRNIVTRHGGTYEKKEKHSVKGYRVDVRNSIYGFIHFDCKPVFVRKIRGRELIALLDVSGSMMPYSIWAVTCLATIATRVKYLVLFSDKINIVSIKHKRSKIFVEFLHNVLLTEFKGYTDIAGALDTSLKLARKNDIIILISDLKQTLPGDPLASSEKIVNKGLRLLAIVPPKHDYNLANKLRSIGVDIIIARTPYDIPHILKRKLNLKAGLVKEIKRL